MRFGSLFTGVGGLDLGLDLAGHEPVFQCELSAYRRRVLAHHWPDVPRYEDVREVASGRIDRGPRDLDGGPGGADPERPRQHAPDDPGRIDLLAGGFPCQDLSVAGRRAGLAGDRSGLFFEFARCADALLGAGGWLLIENVPGLLSSPGRDKATGIDRTGWDFAVLLATLADLGFHDLAWRVLDSRFFGVPQRRRRVFILARRAGGRRAATVLFDAEGGGGDLAAGDQEGAQLAASLTRGSSGRGVSAPGRRQEDDTNLVARSINAHHGRSDGDTEDFIVNALDGRRGGADDNEAQAGHLIANTLRAEGHDASEDGTGRQPALVVAGTVRSHGRPGSNDSQLVSSPLDSDGAGAPSGLPRWLDRCAFDPSPDGPRDEALGDAVTVPVAAWIGRRLAEHG